MDKIPQSSIQSNATQRKAGVLVVLLCGLVFGLLVLALLEWFWVTREPYHGFVLCDGGVHE